MESQRNCCLRQRRQVFDCPEGMSVVTENERLSMIEVWGKFMSVVRVQVVAVKLEGGVR